MCIDWNRILPTMEQSYARTAFLGQITSICEREFVDLEDLVIAGCFNFLEGDVETALALFERCKRMIPQLLALPYLRPTDVLVIEQAKAIMGTYDADPDHFGLYILERISAHAAKLGFTAAA